MGSDLKSSPYLGICLADGFGGTSQLCDATTNQQSMRVCLMPSDLYEVYP